MRHFLFVLCLVFGLGVFSNTSHSFEPGEIVEVTQFCSSIEQAKLFAVNKATECYEPDEPFDCLFIQYHGDLGPVRIASCAVMQNGMILPIPPIFAFAPKDIVA